MKPVLYNWQGGDIYLPPIHTQVIGESVSFWWIAIAGRVIRPTLVEGNFGVILSCRFQKSTSSLQCSAEFRICRYKLVSCIINNEFERLVLTHDHQIYANLPQCHRTQKLKIVEFAPVVVRPTALWHTPCWAWWPWRRCDACWAWWSCTHQHHRPLRDVTPRGTELQTAQPYARQDHLTENNVSLIKWSSFSHLTVKCTTSYLQVQ